MNLTQEEKRLLAEKINELHDTCNYFLNDEVTFEQLQKSFQRLDIEFFALTCKGQEEMV